MMKEILLFDCLKKVLAYAELRFRQPESVRPTAFVSNVCCKLSTLVGVLTKHIDKKNQFNCYNKF
ncbi:MAG: hypothetical protein IJV35_00185 [Neisseriaceae bacterium]|nr:hypothetical protein [Neisseriaceae bacterium]